MMLVPIAVFCIVLKKSSNLKALIKSISINFLIGIQSYRILGGIYWFLLLAGRRATLFFALAPAVFDFFVGVFALALIFLKKENRSVRRMIKVWNYIGLFDFVLAFSIYFLYFPFFILKAPPEMIMWAGFYPVAFIVLFAVPLSVILHITAIKKLNEAEAAYVQSNF